MTQSYKTRNVAQPHHHQVCELYIKALSLKDSERFDLRRRKLSEEQINKAQYATKQTNNVANTANALGKLKTSGLNLDGVPGFYTDEHGHAAQSKVSGLVIPVRDYNGHITSLLVRNSKAKTGKSGKIENKYLAFSSSKEPGGAKVYQTTHCPIVKGPPKKAAGASVRITEGILKADIATALDDIYCLGMHGLNVQKDLPAVLEELEVSELIISLDAGEDSHEDMLRAKVKLILLARELGIDAHVEIWDAEYGKGIDDVLAAGHKDKITRASASEIEAIVRAEKPIIEVLGGGLSDQATEGAKALIKAGLPIYHRGENLVTPVIELVEASGGRQAKIAVLYKISKARMTDYLCSTAAWVKYNKQGDIYYINPPPAIADTILNRYGAWDFQKLVGVIVNPTLRPDGSVLKDIGYDSTTRLYLLDSPSMPEIPESPSYEDALAGLAMLEGLLVDFPFAEEASRGVALSALITPIVRGACKVVPIHVIRAPAAGSGKSYLLDVVSAIATGQPCPVMAAGRTEEETEKRLGAALLAGQSMISIDNLNGTLGSDALCQIIERPFVTVRVLGKSEQVTIESRSTIFATGNNIQLLGDMTRRAVQCTLDAKSERPEMRQFRMNPVQMVLEDRGKYIAAILIIVRAYIVAGKPGLLKPPLASFEEWSDLVRSTLVWLGKTDPLESMASVRAEDPTLQVVAEVFSALWEITAGKPYTSKDIVNMALQREENFDNPRPDYIHPALYEALVNAVGDGKGFLTAKALGKWLSRHRGRVCNGLRLENKVDIHGHPAVWWLDKSG